MTRKARKKMKRVIQGNWFREEVWKDLSER